MTDLFVIGAGGFSSEVLHLIELIQEQKLKWKNIFLLDENVNLYGTFIRGVEVIGDIDQIRFVDRPIDVVITISNPDIRQKLFSLLSLNNNISFPTLISPISVIDEKEINLGFGNIIMHFVILSTELNIGHFNIFNSYTGIGHNGTIGNFNSFGPRVAISGNVQIGDSNQFGANVSVLQNRTIGNQNEIWMSSCLLKSIKSNSIYFGIPAKKINL
jgi:sugar O-acyltransferase (sialic acid O-acetyltransferase NeuD family)